MEKVIYWINTHPLYLFLAVSYFLMGFWMCRFQKNLRLRWAEIYLVPLVHLITGFVIARLWALMEVGFDAQKSATIRLYGPVFILPLLYCGWAKLSKRDVKKVLDMATVNVMAGLFCGRISCLKTGCCRGVAIAGDGSPTLPLVQMEMALYVVFGLIIGYRILKGKTNGQCYPLYLIIYGAFRFAAEFFRVEFTTRLGMLHLAHIWSLLSIALGVATYLWNRKICKAPAGAGKNKGVKPKKMEEKQ